MPPSAKIIEAPSVWQRHKERAGHWRKGLLLQESHGLLDVNAGPFLVAPSPMSVNLGHGLTSAQSIRGTSSAKRVRTQEEMRKTEIVKITAELASPHVLLSAANQIVRIPVGKEDAQQRTNCRMVHDGILFLTSPFATFALAEVEDHVTIAVRDALRDCERDDLSSAQKCVEADQKRGVQMHVAGLQCMHGHGQQHELQHRVCTCRRISASPDAQKFPGALEANCLLHKMLNTGQSVLRGTQTSVVVPQLLDVVLNPLIQVRLRSDEGTNHGDPEEKVRSMLMVATKRE